MAESPHAMARLRLKLVTYLYKSGTDTPFKQPVDPPVRPPVVTDGNACGFTLGSGILAKWQEFGGEGGVLGCAASNEQEAGRSPVGTTGRYTLFKGGVIIWHRDGPFAGRSFEVHGCIAALYQSRGGTNSWLGFPVSDEHDVPGGRRSNFEGGYILWNAAIRAGHRQTPEVHHGRSGRPLPRLRPRAGLDHTCTPTTATPASCFRGRACSGRRVWS